MVRRARGRLCLTQPLLRDLQGLRPQRHDREQGPRGALRPARGHGPGHPLLRRLALVLAAHPHALGLELQGRGPTRDAAAHARGRRGRRGGHLRRGRVRVHGRPGVRGAVLLDGDGAGLPPRRVRGESLVDAGAAAADGGRGRLCAAAGADLADGEGAVGWAVLAVE